MGEEGGDANLYSPVEQIDGSMGMLTPHVLELGHHLVILDCINVALVPFIQF